jgi:hypothetical protein
LRERWPVIDWSMSILEFCLDRMKAFFQVNTLQDFGRISRLTVLIGSQTVKLIMMVWCGCQVNELNNWMSHAIRDPYYWRTEAGGHTVPPFVAGPYSPIWYLLNQPARLGYFGWMSYLFLVDLGFSIWVFWTRRWLFIIPYVAGTIYFYNVDPIDLFIYQFSLLGILTPWYSLLAIVVKIPWVPPLSPWYAWTFVLNDPYALHEPGGVLRWGMIGLGWVGGVSVYAWKRFRKRKRLTLNTEVEKQPVK